MARIVIIGAGLTGISTAYHLEKKGFFDYLLFERESSSGGLCRSITHDGFTFDYTGHLLHANDDYFYDLIQQIVGLEKMNVIDRRSYIYSHDTYTNYPFQINLHGLPASIIVECITEFVAREPNPNPRNFKEWVLSHFGAGLGNQFFFPYQEKIFSYDINQITASWTGRFVPETSLSQMLYGALGNNSAPVGYNARFLYPKQGGIYSWIAPFARALTQPIVTNHEVSSVDMKAQQIVFRNGHCQPYDMLVSTMPLDQLIMISKEKSSTAFNQALPHLKCNSVVNFNLGINRPTLSDKHWIYFPEKKYPFYRVGFWHNFAASMAPAGMSSLYGEFAHLQESPERVSQLLESSLSTVKKLFNIGHADIVTEKIIAINHAYVIYDHWREQHLENLLNQLALQEIYSIGRYGAWKYSSMQEAVLDGKEIADKLLQKLTEIPTHEQSIRTQRAATSHLQQPRI